ncbi:MAG: 4Fe-4S binding protein [Elainella sp. C42_A2020_010]|nr:4Fe-4S binding protein [Elainella sp. C42_A2020_010]
MTYMITNQCIGCNRCESVCPNQAITQNNHQYQINPERCNDCVGHYAVPQCWAACPTTNGCVPDLTVLPQSLTISSNDYWENWFSLYDCLVSRLKANHQSEYWQSWFNTYSRYSQKLSQHLQTPTPVGANA